MRGRAVELGLEAVVGGRGQHDLADRRGVVEDVAEVAAQAADVERLGARERVLLRDGEDELEAHRRAVGAGEAARDLQQHRDRRLVVGAEDAVVGVDPSAVDDQRVHRRAGHHRVQVRAQQQRSLGRALDAREQVAALCPRRRRRIVLGHRDAQRLQLRAHVPAQAPLAAEGALDPAQRREGVVEAAALELAGPQARGSRRPARLRPARPARRLTEGSPSGARSSLRSRAARRRTRGTAARGGRAAT